MTVTRPDSSSRVLNISLVQLVQSNEENSLNEYEMTVELEMKPFELIYLNVTERAPIEASMEALPVVAKEMEVGLNSQFLLKSGKYSVNVGFDKETNMTK